jgi:hypothetical protein
LQVVFPWEFKSSAKVKVKCIVRPDRTDYTVSQLCKQHIDASLLLLLLKISATSTAPGVTMEEDPARLPGGCL